MPRRITPPAELTAALAAHRAASRDDGRADNLPDTFRLPLGADLGELTPGEYVVNDDGTLSPKPLPQADLRPHIDRLKADARFITTELEK